MATLIGKNGVYKKYRNLNKLYNLIQQDIQKMEGKVLSVKEKDILSIKTSLAKLVKDLSNKKFDKNTLNGYLRNIFSTQIGEFIISKGVNKTLNLARNQLWGSLAGDKNYNIKESPELKSLLDSYGQLGETKFKTDNSFKNVSIAINENQDSVNINLGISTKWYKGSNNRVYDVVITNEKSFAHRIDQMLITKIDKYYAYNALGLVEQNNSVYSALKSALIARDLDAFISGLGKQGDYSQFLVINGNFYSIWQIINAVKMYNLGQGSYDKGNATDPITISATGLKQVAELTEAAKYKRRNTIEALFRSKQQNELIRTLGLSAHFYPNRLRNILK